MLAWELTIGSFISVVYGFCWFFGWHSVPLAVWLLLTLLSVSLYGPAHKSVLSYLFTLWICLYFSFIHLLKCQSSDYYVPGVVPRSLVKQKTKQRSFLFVYLFPWSSSTQNDFLSFVFYCFLQDRLSSLHRPKSVFCHLWIPVAVFLFLFCPIYWVLSVVVHCYKLVDFRNYAFHLMVTLLVSTWLFMHSQ